MSSQAEHEAEMIQAICPGVDEIVTPTGALVVTFDQEQSFGYIAIGKNGLAIRINARANVESILRATHQALGEELKRIDDGDKSHWIGVVDTEGGE